MYQQRIDPQSNDQSKDQQQQEEYCLCENPLIRAENNTCEECTHSISSKLTEQINELQNKLRFYERKNDQIQRMVQQYQQTYELKCITSVKQSLEKEIMTEKEAQKQIVYLKNRLSQIQANLQEQIQISKELDCQQTQLEQQLISLQSQQLKLSQQLLMLQGSCHSVSLTQSKLKYLLQVLSKTNFINVMFSISFEDDNSFLNGQKVTHDNCWKIVEIIAFYHQIYAQNYKPVVDIMLQTMQVCFIDPQESQVCSLNESHSQIKTNSIAKIDNSINFSKDPIDILCISQEQIYYTWFPLIIYETKNLFQFLAQQSGIGPQYRLKYTILPNGQFETIIKAQKQKKIDLNKKLNLSIKYLLSIIEQINKLEFFARQKRIQSQMNRKLSQND